jgi:putative peptide zinc metalloprotease protein
MQKAGKTFSESWHRVAGLKIGLRPTVEVRKQLFRGEIWFVLHDPFNNQFFRLRPVAHDFVIRLGLDRTVEQVWLACLDRNPDEAPGQEDVIQLLTQLYFANLLYFEVPGDSAKLFERYKKRRQREIRSRLLSIMFVRIPLFDPDYLLKKLMPVFKYIISPLGAVIWLLVVGAAIKLVFDHFDRVSDQVQGILAPDNLVLLYVGLIIIKSLHEFGHALVCRRFGGEVHTMGVMLLIFTPLPYMDATSSWSFRSRWQRALVGGAGMIIEIFLAALATFVWANTGPGTLHSLAYNMMFIASVSTVLFNANPLLRFDGYYILSDLLDIPNLHTRSKGHLRHLVECYVFGYKDSHSPAESIKEAWWLGVFGVLAGIYRVVVFTGIILFVADKFLLAGMLMALICVISWVVVPIYKLVTYLASSPRLARTRVRAVTISICFFLILTALLGVIPFPNRFRAPGVLEAIEYVRVVNDAPGYVDNVLVASGMKVQVGTPLMELADYELEIEIEATRAQQQEAQLMYSKTMHLQRADLDPIRKRLETIEAKLQDLEKQRTDLIIKARQDGVWVAPDIEDMVGSWLARGSAIGNIVNHSTFRFSAVVSQDEAADLFVDKIRKAEVRLFGQGGKNLDVAHLLIIPFQQEKLPSAALGWRGGGEVPVSVTDETGLQAAEPFFQIHATVKPSAGAALLHGRSGKLRFSLNPKPLLLQWGHKFRQLLQRRYQI